jgi:putative oxidoreductase
VVAAPKRTPHRLSPVEPITVPRYLGGWWIPDVAIAVLRVAVALLFALHGTQELFGLLLPPGQKWLGAPEPLTDRWLAASLELLGATLLATGTFTRLAAFGSAALVVLSYFAPLRARGHWTFNGAELIAVVSVVLITFSIIGPGLFSIDALREGRHRPRSGGATVSLSPWIRRQYRHRELTR